MSIYLASGSAYRLLKKVKDLAAGHFLSLREIQAEKGPEGWAKGFKQAIADLSEENPKLAEKAQAAWLQKWDQGGHTLTLDFSKLPETKMQYFMEGPWSKVVGARGTRQPFVSVKAINRNTLVIHHEGDIYPLLIEWRPVSRKQPIRVERRHYNRVYRVLTLPEGMVEPEQMKNLKANITELISASHMNPFIAASQTKVMKVAAYLHDGKLIRKTDQVRTYSKS